MNNADKSQISFPKSSSDTFTMYLFSHSKIFVLLLLLHYSDDSSHYRPGTYNVYKVYKFDRKCRVKAALYNYKKTR